MDHSAEALIGLVVARGNAPERCELDLLRRRWRQARAAEGQVVLISGEP